MYKMNCYLEIKSGKEWITTPMISEISIERSIKNLADFATITCPIFHLNKLILFKESYKDEAENPEKTKQSKLLIAILCKMYCLPYDYTIKF